MKNLRVEVYLGQLGWCGAPPELQEQFNRILDRYFLSPEAQLVETEAAEAALRSEQ